MSSWLPTAPCTPKGCATHQGHRVGALTASARLLSGLTVLTAGVALSPLARLLGAAGRDRLTRCWSRALIRAFGLRVRIAAAQEPRSGPGEGVLVVSNHISWLDVALIAAVYPGRMLAKSEIRRWPVLGRVAAGGGTLFVERERLRALPAAVRTLATALTEGSKVAAFPEACTWCGWEEGRFTSAVFQSALDAGAAVRPVRIAYLAEDGRSSGATAFVGDDTLPASLWRVVTAGGLTAEITVLPLIPAGSLTDRRALARVAWEAVTGREGPAGGQAEETVEETAPFGLESGHPEGLDHPLGADGTEVTAVLGGGIRIPRQGGARGRRPRGAPRSYF